MVQINLDGFEGNAFLSDSVRVGPRSDLSIRNNISGVQNVLTTMKFVGDVTSTTVQGGFTVGVREIVDAAVLETTGAVQRDIEIFAKALRTRVGGNRVAIRNVHRDAAQSAQRAMLRAYATAHGRGTGGNAQSRTRNANGKLYAALSNPAMIDWDKNTVSFINPAFLNQTASHWYRLNFGAGMRGIQETRPARSDANIVFFNQAVGNISLRGNRPSPTFAMPAGAFVIRGTSNPAPGAALRDFPAVSRARVRDSLGGSAGNSETLWGGPNESRRSGNIPGGGSLDEFIADTGANAGLISQMRANTPSGGLFAGYGYSSNGTLSRGIRGSHFLDAGIKRLSLELSRGYTRVMREWLEESRNEAGPFFQATRSINTDVNVGRALGRIKRAEAAMETAARNARR